jgi:hypothetical protein
MKDVDILPIQEHWLFKFEEKEIVMDLFVAMR